MDAQRLEPMPAPPVTTTPAVSTGLVKFSKDVVAGTMGE